MFAAVWYSSLVYRSASGPRHEEPGPSAGPDPCGEDLDPLHMSTFPMDVEHGHGDLSPPGVGQLVQASGADGTQKCSSHATVLIEANSITVVVHCDQPEPDGVLICNNLHNAE